MTKKTQIMRKKAKKVAKENLIWLFSSLIGFFFVFFKYQTGFTPMTKSKIEPNNEEKKLIMYPKKI